MRSGDDLSQQANCGVAQLRAAIAPPFQATEAPTFECTSTTIFVACQARQRCSRESALPRIYACELTFTGGQKASLLFLFFFSLSCRSLYPPLSHSTVCYSVQTKVDVTRLFYAVLQGLFQSLEALALPPICTTPQTRIERRIDREVLEDETSQRRA